MARQTHAYCGSENVYIGSKNGCFGSGNVCFGSGNVCFGSESVAETQRNNATYREMEDAVKKRLAAKKRSEKTPCSEKTQ